MTEQLSPFDGILRRTALKAVGAGGVLSLTAQPIAAADDQADEEDDEPGDRDCEVDIRLGERQLVIDHGGFSPEAYVVAIVENAGTVASGQITITVDWIDADGGRIDDNSSALPSLGAGETWLAHVRSFTDPEEIADFDVTGEFETGHPRAPAELAVTESEYRLEDNEIAGIAENARDEDLDRVEAIAKMYDEEGTVLGGDSTMEFDLPAGRDWTFEIRMPRLPEVVDDAPDYDVPEVTAHDVRLAGDTFRVEDVT